VRRAGHAATRPANSPAETSTIAARHRLQATTCRGSTKYRARKRAEGLPPACLNHRKIIYNYLNITKKNAFLSGVVTFITILARIVLYGLSH
jgi:hypothetical protein